MKNKRFWFGILISLVCLALALRGVAWAALFEALASAQYLWLLPALAALGVTMTARVIRWRLLLGPGVSLGESAAAFGIGYLVSNVLPFRLGDLARAAAVGGAGGGRPSRSQAFSTVVVERVLDMLLVALLLAAVLPFTPHAPAMVVRAGWLGGLGALAALLVLPWLAGQGERARRWLVYLLTPLPGLNAEVWGRRALALLAGLDVLRQRRIWAVVAWSFVVWLTNIGVAFFTLHAFDLQPGLNKAVMVLCVTSLGLALPSSPGSFGVYHLLASAALVTPFGAPQETSLSFALALHTLQYVALCSWGLAALAGRSLSWRQLRVTIHERPESAESVMP